jgi:hypothetical protein
MDIQYSTDDRYKIVNGTYYNRETPDGVISWLETSRERRQRIRIFYGKDGRCWNEEYDTIGHVSRSMGTIKIPILIKSSVSTGGGAILDDCIVRIDTKGSNGEIRTVYQDIKTHFDHFISTDIGTVYNKTKNELYARCKNAEAGRKLAAFMNGKRWAK